LLFSRDIVIDESEIASALWMPAQDGLARPQVGAFSL
jgi:hypothetical protein